MVEDAETLKGEDQKKRGLVDANNAADSMIYQTEKNLKEYEGKVSPDDAKKLEAGIEQIRDALKTENADSIKSATEELNTLWQEVGKQMYQDASAQGAAQGADAGPGAGPGPGPQAGPQPGPDGGSSDGGDDKVVDADYEILDEETK